jgi:hypothetical protein
MRKKVVYLSLTIAIFVALTLYFAVGFGGAAMFGDQIKDNIFIAFRPCKWLWVDIVSIIYALVVIIVYPLVLYPVKVSIVKMSGRDPQSKRGYIAMVITSACFVVLSMGLAMVLESIITIFGLFSSLTGIIFYFVVPLVFWIKFPKVKMENIHMDNL